MNLTEDPILNQISVCICTYKRPEMLKQSVESIISQTTNNEFYFTIIIIDNDITQSAKAVVKELQKKSPIKIVYKFEPEKNIALARNLAVKTACTNFIAFIDDDEIAIKNWLYKLYRTLISSEADGVLGPVLPSYSEEAPNWLSKCKLFDRRRFLTGTKLNNPRDTRTGNVLLSVRSLSKEAIYFDPSYGLSGGEDVNLFEQLIEKGHTFIWCDEAIAYETIPQERWKSSFYIKRYFRGGLVNAKRYRHSIKFLLISIPKSIVSIFFWFIAFIFSIPFGKHIWFRPIIKLSYFSGLLLSIFGFSIYEERE